MVDATQESTKVVEDRSKAREAARKAAEKTLEDQDKERAFNNAESSRRMNESRPTPTQRENDLARLGHPVMEKEDDGSGPDPTTLTPEEQRKLRDETDKRRSSVAASDGATYRTRSTESAKTPAPAAPKP